MTEPEFIKVFGSRVIDKGNYFFIPKFLLYQCPSGLGSNKPAIISIKKELEKYNLIQTVSELLGNDFLIIKGKEKGKGKGKGEDKGKEEGEYKQDAKYITVDDEVVFDPMPILEFHQAALNGRQSEHKTRSWREVAGEWFNTVVQQPFKDETHVFNTFSKYLITFGKPPTGNNRSMTPIQKFSMDDLKVHTAK